MTQIRIVLLGLVLACSAVDANPLWGVWYGEHPEAADRATFTFGEDGTFKVELSTYDEEEAAGVFAELFGDLLHDLDLSVEGLAELGLAIPTITYVVMEGSYAVEGDFLTAYTTRFLLRVDGELIEVGQLMADIGRQALDQLDEETADAALVVALNLLAESGPLITELVAEGMGEEPLIASGFSIQEGLRPEDGYEQLTFHEGEFAGAVFVRDGTVSPATSVQTMSWAHIKGWIAP